MRKCNLRSGSALLIVLGMLTFLIVSAVGFSAYMRQGRLPSSQLRRTVAGRHLVKAAMAEAIDTIDQAINDNPHPGVGDRKPDGASDNINFWHNRIFMGTNQWNEANFVNSVSPLSLEALAYIPPPLINDARYFSRLSLAAQWKSFDFDVGRYAFCAIDVSDYFDVNRLFANKRRSSAPHERVSLSYLFEKGKDHNRASGSDAEAWDKFMEGFRKVDNNTGAVTYDGSSSPLISLADFNLAFHKYGGVGEMKSPFCEYLESGTGEIVSMDENGAAGSDAMLSRMTFVTDSLFPKTKNGTTSASNSSSGDNEDREILDLADSENQPFDPRVLSKKDQTPDTLMNTFMAKNFQGKRRDEWAYALGNIGSVCLYDYLDVDQKPLSLAMPTIERFPMICGIQPVFQDITVAIKREVEPSDDETSDGYSNILNKSETERTVEKTIIYKIDPTKFQEGLRAGMVRAVTVFPFARKNEDDGKFKVDGKLSFFFSSEPMSLRTSDSVQNEDDVFHLEKEIEETSIDSKNGILNIKLGEQEITYNDSINEESDAVTKADIKLIADTVGQELGDVKNAFLKVVFRWSQTAEKSNNGPTLWKPALSEVINEGDISKINFVSTAFPAFDAYGKTDEKFASSDALKSTVLKGDVKVRLNCAVWLRVKNEDGYVVDMAPACIEDDRIQNNVDAGIMKQLGSRGRIDPAFPLLRFNTGVDFDFSLAHFEGNNGNQSEESITLGVVKDLSPKAAVVADPRYNYAPEDWFSVDESLTEQVWISNKNTGLEGRDRDIFMETSDAGYLQSIYELAFLPRTKSLENNGNSSPQEMSEEFSTKDNKYRDIAKVTTFEDTRNKKIAWRTYNPFSVDETYGDREGFKKFPFVNEGNGFKVNPYSDSTNVMMAVFANTPAGWRYSTTNKVEGASVDYSSLKIDEFNENYAFNAYSKDDSSKVAWADLESVAGEFMYRIRENPEKDWEEVFTEKMDWIGAQDDQEGALPGMDNKSSETTAKFWGVDKKFLYGFWKDCFAVKQQLFLVFVRAEPAMMGSGATGHTPPQLGGKAVALVWRDPTKSTETNSNSNRAMPHKTRVLFYRQFE